MKTKTKKKEVKKTIQPKKEYGPAKKKEYKEDQPVKIRKQQISNPFDVVSISMTREDLFFIQKKTELSNPRLSEYMKTMLEVTERQKEMIEDARLSVEEIEHRKAEDANRRY